MSVEKMIKIPYFIVKIQISTLLLKYIWVYVIQNKLSWYNEILEDVAAWNFGIVYCFTTLTFHTKSYEMDSNTNLTRFHHKFLEKENRRGGENEKNVNLFHYRLTIWIIKLHFRICSLSLNITKAHMEACESDHCSAFCC